MLDSACGMSVHSLLGPNRGHMTGMGFSATGLSIFFAATVFVVFGSGLMPARLARRLSPARTGMAGLLIALAGGLWLMHQAASPQPFWGFSR